jgi:chorismate mutase
MTPTSVRGIRGATTVEEDRADLVLEATRELLVTMLERNGIESFDAIAAIFFTTTPDVRSTFPAEAARALGMTMVPMLCNQEIPVPGRLGMAVRVMLQLNTSKRQDEIRHVYLRGATVLRPDLVSAQ